MDSFHISSSVKSPAGLEDLTPEWFHIVLNLSDGDGDVTLTSNDHQRYKFEITSNAGEGSGFVCNLVRVKVLRRESETETSAYAEYRNIIVKLLHHVEVYRDLALREKFDITEINFYQHIAPTLINLVPELGSYLCGHVYSNVTENAAGEDPAPASSRTSVLVLEDMKPLRYRILRFREEFTMKQVGLGIDFLAKLHSACKCLETLKGKQLPQVFGRDFLPNFLISGAEFANKWRELIPDGFPRFDKFIRSYDPTVSTSADVRAQVIAAHGLTPKHVTVSSLDTLAKIVDAGKTHASLTHLDLWRCNILVHDGSSGDLPLIKIIDWQTVLYLDSTYDLSTYLLSTLPLDMLTRPIVDGFAEKHYKLLTNAAEERSLEEFMHSFSTYAMAFALFWFMNSYDSNPELPEYHPRFWKVTQLLYLEYGIHDFVNHLLM